MRYVERKYVFLFGIYTDRFNLTRLDSLALTSEEIRSSSYIRTEGGGTSYSNLYEWIWTVLKIKVISTVNVSLWDTILLYVAFIRSNIRRSERAQKGKGSLYFNTMHKLVMYDFSIRFKISSTRQAFLLCSGVETLLKYLQN